MQKKIDCIKRLFDMTDCYQAMVEFLLEEKILTDGDVVELKLALNKPKFLYEIIVKAESEDKLTLASFDWVILPVERIKIHLVTERSSKEFTYQY